MLGCQAFDSLQYDTKATGYVDMLLLLLFLNYSKLSFIYRVY